MKRILVLGCGGAGKSTFSIKLGHTLGVPVHHLDLSYWKPGWEPSERKEFTSKLAELMKDERWILDGNYMGTLDVRAARADTVIFLNMSTITCLSGIVLRRFSEAGRSRPDLGVGNKDRLDPEFAWYVLTFNWRKRPMLVKILSALVESVQRGLWFSTCLISAFSSSRLHLASVGHLTDGCNQHAAAGRQLSQIQYSISNQNLTQ